MNDDPIIRIPVPFRRSELEKLGILDAGPAARYNAVRRKAKLPTWQARRGAPVRRKVAVEAPESTAA